MLQSYGSSLSCSPHGAHSAAFDVSFIWDIGSCGRWQQWTTQLWILEELGGHGGTHPVQFAVSRVSAVRRPGVHPDGMSWQSQEPSQMLKILISGRVILPVRLQSASVLNKSHFQKVIIFKVTFSPFKIQRFTSKTD